VLEAHRREARALSGGEVAVHRNRVFVTGRIAGKDAETIDIEKAVRDVYRSAGYGDGDGWYPSPEEVVVESHLCLGPLEDGEAEFRELSNDQAICVGYTNNLPQTNHLPVEHCESAREPSRLDFFAQDPEYSRYSGPSTHRQTGASLASVLRHTFTTDCWAPTARCWSINQAPFRSSRRPIGPLASLVGHAQQLRSAGPVLVGIAFRSAYSAPSPSKLHGRPCSTSSSRGSSCR